MCVKECENGARNVEMSVTMGSKRTGGRLEERLEKLEGKRRLRKNENQICSNENGNRNFFYYKYFLLIEVRC